MANANSAIKRLMVFGIRIILLFFILVLNSGFILGDIVINEVMYNPAGTDSGHEWIEIYTDNPINNSVDISGKHK